MRPPSGLSAPEIWWIRVVFPAPFGPISAWISPARTSKLASSVTVSAPKRLTSLSTISKGCSSAMGGPSPEEAAQALRREQHDGQQKQTQRHLPVQRVAGQHLLQ